MYSDAPDDIKDRELKFIKQQREEEKKLAGRDGTGGAGDGGMTPTDDELAELGAALGGNANNPHNKAAESVDIKDAKEDNGVENISDYKAYEKNRDERLQK